MGFEGFVVLGVAIVVIAVVIPTLTRQKFVAASTPLEDRYADDLRLLSVAEASVAHSGGDHGTVFFRRPEVGMAEERMVNIRGLARDRARLRAGMSKRTANLQRGFFGACALGLLALGLWIAVAATTIGTAVAWVATVVTIAYSGGFGWLVRQAREAETEDRRELARLDAELRAHRPIRKSGRRGGTAAERRAAREASRVETESIEAPVMKLAVKLEAEKPVERTAVPVRTAVAEEPRKKPVSVTKAPRVAPAAESEMPSYTLKPRAFERKVVDPYVAPEAPAAAVPYRPQEAGERLESAEVAPVMKHSGEVLRGGSVLDDLLDRRRA